MKKNLIILAEILVLFVFLRSDFAAYFLDDLRAATADKIEAIATMPERRELQKLRDSIRPHIANMNDAQKSYLEDVTENKDKLNRFYYLYCVNKDLNPYVYGANLVYFCGEVSRMGLVSS
ncbi:hypothetical protein EYS14_17740 [Alteromonadaceae bacterium M269]|nr:hypothetical protein EYS14_17740 [Alteromonadaceae bacterium M269]